MPEGQDGVDKTSHKVITYYCANLTGCPYAAAYAAAAYAQGDLANESEERKVGKEESEGTDVKEVVECEVYTNDMIVQLIRDGCHTAEGYPTCPHCSETLQKDSGRGKTRTMGKKTNGGTLLCFPLL